MAPVKAGMSGAAPAVIARQGIYDTKNRVVAYELLFRPVSAGDVQLSDPDAATAQVLMTAFSDVGLDALVGAQQAFVNIPYAFLTNGYCETLPRERVVLEILEDVQIDRRVVDVARALVASGHSLALDDFVFRDGIEPLVELAQVVKLDVLALSPAELRTQVDRLRPYDVTLLAEKVEHVDQMPGLREMGFELFQGFALQRPTTVHARTTDVNKTVLLQILAAVHEPDITPAALVDTVSRDPAIVYALLRIVSSAHLSLSRQITSLHQALVLLGVDGLRNWTTMMVMAQLSPDSQELLASALIRAKMCELCAHENDARAAVAFTAGLLSTLPDALGRSLEEIVDLLALAPELRSALLEHKGAEGHVLAWVLSYEAQDQRELAQLGAPESMAGTFVDAVEWSSNVTGLLTTAPN